MEVQEKGKKTDEDESDSLPRRFVAEKEAQHVMISYEWGVQKEIVRISEELRRRNFKVSDFADEGRELSRANFPPSSSPKGVARPQRHGQQHLGLHGDRGGECMGDNCGRVPEIQGEQQHTPR